MRVKVMKHLQTTSITTVGLPQLTLMAVAVLKIQRIKGFVPRSPNKLNPQGHVIMSVNFFVNLIRHLMHRNLWRIKIHVMGYGYLYLCHRSRQNYGWDMVLENLMRETMK